MGRPFKKGDNVGSKFDDMARAIATEMPRRKLLKLMAGGIAASISSALLSKAAAAQSGATESAGEVNQSLFINGGFIFKPGVNYAPPKFVFPPIGVNNTYPFPKIPIDINNTKPYPGKLPIGINNTFPFPWKHGK